MVLKIECQSGTILGTAWRAEVTQQRGGQSGGQRMRVELKEVLPWITEVAIGASQCVYL